MATRRRIERKTVKQESARVYKDITRAYGFWALGLVIGALGLTPSTVSASGLALTIGKPQLVQGIIFLVSLAYATRALLSLQNRINPYLQADAIRTFIWSALPKGTRSFRGLTHQDLIEAAPAATSWGSRASSRPAHHPLAHTSPSGAPRPSLSGSVSSCGVNSSETELMQ